MDNNLRLLVSSVDDKFGDISLNIEDLKTIKTNFSSAMEKLEKIDPFNSTRNNIIIQDVYPILLMVESLLNYSVKDLSNNYNKGNEFNSVLFDLVYQDKNKVNKLEDITNE